LSSHNNDHRFILQGVKQQLAADEILPFSATISAKALNGCSSANMTFV